MRCVLNAADVSHFQIIRFLPDDNTLWYEPALQWIRTHQAKGMIMDKPVCKIIRPSDTYDGKQGFSYFEGIAAETVGSTGVCMHLLVIPPGARAKAHKHENHETAIYVISGAGDMYYGDNLEHHMVAKAGEFLYIPAGVPHLPFNTSETEPCVAVIARTDPNEQESVVLLPELEAALMERER
jgi:uncharacterized RmlC-like cupin family protein